MRKLLVGLVCLLALTSVGVTAAQDMQNMTPSVTVSDQFVFGDEVVIDDVYSAGSGFLVIHIDNNGTPGPVAGYAPVYAGDNRNVRVSIDTSMATPMLFAMLHEDTGVVGTYEFGTVQGVDLPVSVDGHMVTPPFNVAIIDAYDQSIMGDTVTIKSVTTPVDGFMVIHSGDASNAGPVLGVTPISAGTTANVEVTLAADGRTDVLWPMLHVDDHAIGTYEFGTVQGADAPVFVNGVVATAPIWTVPHMRVDSQIVTHGDNAPAMDMMEGDMGPHVHVHGVLAEVPGFVVIHVDNNGAPGPVAGYAPVPAGFSEDVDVPVDASMLTPVLWPMLHVDDHTMGTYEFGTVEGADGPVKVNDKVLTFPINAAPSLKLMDQALGEGGTITIPEAVIDAAGWIAIHSDNNGQPGPVIGTAWIPAGVSTNVVVTLSDPSMAGSQVFPMLHYDTGEAGVYEFGTVEGADAPVVVGGSVVFAPMAIQ